MARIAANLSFLFTELPMVDRFAAARAAGFEGAEVLFPYDFAAIELHAAAVRAGLPMVLLNTPPPNWAGGPRGFAAVPGLEARFRQDFDLALRFAEALRVRHIHIMAGKASGPRAEATFLANLRWAAERAPHASLLIEPCNRVDLPGYFLADFDQAAAVIAAVGAPNLGLLFDVYHAHMIATACAPRDPGPDQTGAIVVSHGAAGGEATGGDAAGGSLTPANHASVPEADPGDITVSGPDSAPGRRQMSAVEALWSAHSALVRHVQIAGAPGRHEPRGGEIDYTSFFQAVDASGYSGWVSAEYTPRTSTEAGLRWLRGSAKG